jgi:hypothetical protein
MTQASVGVPVTPVDVGQKAVDCESVVVGGVTYYRQNINARMFDGAGNPLTSISDFGVGYGAFCISEPIGYQIAKGGIAGHESYTAFGYDSAIPTTITDISGRSVNVIVPTTAILMEVVSSSANDAGTLVTSGTSTGGTTTTIIDTGKNFITLGVLAGDFLLNDTDVALGIVVTIDSATQITFEPVSVFSYATPKAYRIVRTTSTGAAIVEHHGLDSNWNENSEFFVMNGLTPVSSTKTFIRSNNFHAMTRGTAGTPIGNISLRDDATGAITYNYIAAGLNMSLQCHYSVPAGKVMFIPSWHAGSVGNKPSRSLLRATADFHDRALIPGVFHVNSVLMHSNGTVERKFELPKRFPAKCDVKISSNTIGAGTSEIGCGFEFWIEDAA